MTKPLNLTPEQINREKQLFRYISAIERGDLDQMTAMLEQAQTDPVLQKMIEETHDVYVEEDGIKIGEAELAKARNVVNSVLRAHGMEVNE